MVLGTIVGSGIWNALLRRHPAGVVAPYSLLVPVVGIVLAAVALGERPGVVDLVAAVVIVGGLLLGTPRPPRAPEPTTRAVAPATSPCLTRHPGTTCSAARTAVRGVR